MSTLKQRKRTLKCKNHTENQWAVGQLKVAARMGNHSLQRETEGDKKILKKINGWNFPNNASTDLGNATNPKHKKLEENYTKVQHNQISQNQY